jgi:hypothetical protein
VPGKKQPGPPPPLPPEPVLKVTTEAATLIVLEDAVCVTVIVLSVAELPKLDEVQASFPLPVFVSAKALIFTPFLVQVYVQENVPNVG